MLMVEATKDTQYQKAKIFFFFLTIDLLSYGAYQNNVLDSSLVNRHLP